MREKSDFSNMATGGGEMRERFPWRNLAHVQNVMRSVLALQILGRLPCLQMHLKEVIAVRRELATRMVIVPCTAVEKGEEWVTRY